jgi:hypothetical protein
MHVRPTFVLPRYKTVYVAVSKAACTSLKWLVADIQGEDPDRFRASSRMVTRDMGIHMRGRWRRTPTLHSLPERELARIDAANGWFVFTVVRHPAARLFSAWQSKLLLREPKYAERYGAAPWFPRVPHSTEDVVEDFGRFAAAISADPKRGVMRDRHFMPQWVEAAPDRMPYSEVYDTAEIPALLERLAAHLRANGYEGELRLRRTNESPLAPIGALFTPEVRGALERLYGDDYRQLGYDSVEPPRLDPAGSYPDGTFDEIARLVERHERIGDLAALKDPEPAAAAAPPDSRVRRLRQLPPGLVVARARRSAAIRLRRLRRG